MRCNSNRETKKKKKKEEKKKDHTGELKKLLQRERELSGESGPHLSP
jgi:hypothetical protein